MMKSEICLYVIMRSDLDSLNPGKACAQATHAANRCVYRIKEINNAELDVMLETWQENRGFGTCIVLERHFLDIEYLVNSFISNGILSEIIHDPEYPIKDGLVTHLVPLDTCVYAFGPRDVIYEFVKDLELMK